MQVRDFERLVLASCFRWEEAARLALAEITADKFGYGPEIGTLDTSHRKIFNAIERCHGRPTIPEVARLLSGESYGGEVYLKDILGSLQAYEIVGMEGLGRWIRVVDGAGRLRVLKELLDEYQSLYEDYERLVMEVEDVDQFLADFMAKMQAVAQGTRSGYVHVSQGVGEFRVKLDSDVHGRSGTILPIGWPSFAKWGIPPLESLTVLAGLSSSGKTQLMLQMALGAAIQIWGQGQKGCVVINSLEMKHWRLVRRMACALSGVPASYLDGGALREHPREDRLFRECLDYLSDLPLYVDDSDLATTSAIRFSCSALHASLGPVRFLGVDYAELLKDKGDTEEQRISAATRNLRSIGRTVGCATVFLSQFSNQVYHTRSKLGDPSMLRHSGAIYHAAEVAAQIWNPVAMAQAKIDFVPPLGLDKESAWLVISKHKDGKVGSFPLNWSPEKTRFEDPALSEFADGLYQGMVPGDF